MGKRSWVLKRVLRFSFVALPALLVSPDAATMPPGGEPLCWSPDCGVCVVVDGDSACDDVPTNGSCDREDSEGGICTGYGRCRTTAVP